MNDAPKLPARAFLTKLESLKTVPNRAIAMKADQVKATLL